MSKLKVIDLGNIRESIEKGESVYYEYYPKSEADKVIAELEKKIKFLQVTAICKNCNKCADGMGKVFDENLDELKAHYKEACDRLQTANLIKDEQLAATRHNKYKRCLAMAKWCEERSARYDVLQERHNLDWGREIEFYYRWYMRWLELAEKFKEDA